MDPCPVCGGNLEFGPHAHGGTWYRHVKEPSGYIHRAMPSKETRRLIDFKMRPAPRWWQLKKRYVRWRQMRTYRKAFESKLPGHIQVGITERDKRG